MAGLAGVPGFQGGRRLRRVLSHDGALAAVGRHPSENPVLRPPAAGDTRTLSAMTTNNPEDPTTAIVQQAEELNQARMNAVRPLAAVLARRKQLQAELAATDEEYGKTYAEAERNGWTAEELKDIGAEEPVRRPRGRPAKRRSSKKTNAASANSSSSGIPQGAEATQNTGSAPAAPSEENHPAATVNGGT